jgi:hypothetical protein
MKICKFKNTFRKQHNLPAFVISPKFALSATGLLITLKFSVPVEIENLPFHESTIQALNVTNFFISSIL